MAKRIKVWSGTEWVDVGVMAAIPTDYVSTTALNTALTPYIDTTELNAALTNYKQEINITVNSNITMQSGYRYFVDTSAARTLTLPASPAVGNEILVFDASGTAATNNVTINSNSGKINGSVQDAVLDVNGGAIGFTYTGSTYGWRVG
jgi:hypothetical protein